MRRFGIVLSAFLGAFGRSGGTVGALLGVLGASEGGLGTSLGAFGLLLGQSWGILDILRCSWGGRGARVGRS